MTASVGYFDTERIDLTAIPLRQLLSSTLHPSLAIAMRQAVCEARHEDATAVQVQRE